MKVFFSVGEPSGDIHGANLVGELKRKIPDIQCVGFGGPRMQSAGCEIIVDLTKLAVMWFFHALLNLHRFWNIYRQALDYFGNQRPDAVVLIDFPGFNWWIARAAKRHGIPVFYYGAPQIWAWARWRIHKMRRLTDHILCKLPFEEKWYREQGCNATYVGHPFFDETANYQLDQTFIQKQRERKGPLVTILPGSRTQEVNSNVRWFIKAGELIRTKLPETRFAFAAFNEKQARIVQENIDKSTLTAEVHVAKTPELISLADCCLACSGSVSLELLYYEKPTVILYWLRRYAYFVQSWFRKVQYITLVNLLTAKDLFPAKVTPFNPDVPEAKDVPFPEYLTWQDKSFQISQHVIRWLSDKPERQRRIGLLQRLKSQYAHPGATQQAANYICAHLGCSKSTPSAPQGSTVSKTAA